MKKRLLVLIIVATAPAFAQADTLGIQLGVNAWQQNFDGYVLSDIDSAINSIDLNDDFGYDDEVGNSIYASFEHPIPVLPNVRLARTKIEASGSNTLNRGLSFNGVDYQVSSAISSNSDLSHTDITLYYEILDNWVSVDIGLTARIFSEGIQLSDGTNSSELDIDITLPMVFIAAKFDLPFTGFYAGAEGNGISYDDNRIIDYSLKLGYEASFGLGVELGYRSFEIDYEDDIEAANITIDGGYLGVFYHF